MTPEIFFQGLPWEDYLASMQANRELLRRKVAEYTLPNNLGQALTTFTGFVLILTEDWCQDSITSLPPLVALAQAIPGLTLRVFRREAHLSLARALLRMEYPPIPTFIFYNAHFIEMGRYIEKPTAWHQIQNDPAEMAWLRADPAMYDATWWELEHDELQTILRRNDA